MPASAETAADVQNRSRPRAHSDAYPSSPKGDHSPAGGHRSPRGDDALSPNHRTRSAQRMNRRRSKTTGSGGSVGASMLHGDNSAEGRLRALYDVSDKVIGKGAYGSVVRGVARHGGLQVAVKRIDKDKVGQKGISYLRSETETLGMLSSPHIVRLVDVFHDPATMIIVMEYVPGGELGKVLRSHGGTFPESTVQRIGYELLLAIDHFHQRGIVHRDLKLANCLVGDVQYRPAPILTSSSLAAAGQTSSVKLESPGLSGMRGSSSTVAGPALQGALPSARRAHSEPDLLHSPKQQPANASLPRWSGMTSPRRDSPPSDEGSLTESLLSVGASFASPSQPAGDASRHTTATTTTHPATGKPDPIVSVKIADFGFGVMVGDAPVLTGVCGTMQYMAPEILRKAPESGVNSYGRPVDMWAFGVMIFYMLVGEHPFSGLPSGSQEAVEDHICSGCYDDVRRMKPAAAERWAHLSQPCKSFIAGLLTVDPTKRLMAVEGLRHAWIRSAVELNHEDHMRREWIREQLDEGFTSGILDDETLGSIGGTAATSIAAGASFATVEDASAAYEAARLVAQRSMVGSPTFAAQRRQLVTRRLRAAIRAVLAAHRLVYVAQIRKLHGRPGLADIPVLHSFRFLVTGRYEPSGAQAQQLALSDSATMPGTHRLTIAARPAAAFRANVRALGLLLRMVEASTTVEVLNLSDIGLDNVDAIQKVARIATSHPSLTTLDLSHNPIPPLAGRSLVRLARSATRLRHLNLGDTPLPADTVQSIQQRLATSVQERAAAASVAAAASPTGVPGSPSGVLRREALSVSASQAVGHGAGAASPERHALPVSGDATLVASSSPVHHNPASRRPVDGPPRRTVHAATPVGTSSGTASPVGSRRGSVPSPSGGSSPRRRTATTPAPGSTLPPLGGSASPPRLRGRP